MKAQTRPNTNRVALVTGGTGGLGQSVVTRLLREGATVFCADLTDRAGSTAIANDASFIELDVTSQAQWEMAVNQIEAQAGRLDVLINNAGVVSTAGAVQETEAGWTRVVAVNQTGVFFGLRAAVPALKRAGGGAIVNVASNLGLVGTQGYFAYQASKGAVVQMTRAAAVDYAADDIRVNCVCPGLIDTPMLADEDARAIATFVAATPQGRAARPDEVAAAVCFLASSEASYITGEALVVDGGYAAR